MTLSLNRRALIASLCTGATFVLCGCKPAINNLHSGAQGIQTQPLSNVQTDYRTTARQAAIEYGISPDLFVRQINAESGFNPNAISSSGAIGIAQFMLATAEELNVNPYDPNASLYAAARLMKRYQDRYGTYQMALAAYNAGPSALDNALRSPGGWFAAMPSETQQYINTIME